MEISALNAFLSPELKMKSPPPQPKPSAPERTPLLYKISSVMALLEISHATVYRMVEKANWS